MKKVLLTICLLLMVAGSLQGQSRFVWQDSIKVTTAAVDTSIRFETASLMFVGTAGWVRLATHAADTLGWTRVNAGKQWLYMPASTPLVVLKNKDLGITGLHRLEYKGAGAGALFIWGTKKVAE